MKDNDRDENRQWFERHIGNDLRKFDEAHNPLPPRIEQLEAMVAVHKRHARKALWKELLLFWLIAAVIMAGMMWVLERNWVWFAVIQSAAAAGAVLFLSFYLRKKVNGRWKNS